MKSLKYIPLLILLAIASFACSKNVTKNDIATTHNVAERYLVEAEEVTSRALYLYAEVDSIKQEFILHKGMQNNPASGFLLAYLSGSRLPDIICTNGKQYLFDHAANTIYWRKHINAGLKLYMQEDNIVYKWYVNESDQSKDAFFAGVDVESFRNNTQLVSWAHFDDCAMPWGKMVRFSPLGSLYVLVDEYPTTGALLHILVYSKFVDKPSFICRAVSRRSRNDHNMHVTVNGQNDLHSYFESAKDQYVLRNWSINLPFQRIISSNRIHESKSHYNFIIHGLQSFSSSVLRVPSEIKSEIRSERNQGR